MARICLLCDSVEIELEIHFLMDCSYCSNIRRLVCAKNYSNKICNSEKQFLDILSTDRDYFGKAASIQI